MRSLTNSEIPKQIKVIIEKKTDLFMSFEEMYIFGSVVSGKKFPNDIDLLLIYDEYKKDILSKIENIQLQVEAELSIQVDLTVLSKAEIDETCFLSRLQKYIRIK